MRVSVVGQERWRIVGEKESDGNLGFLEVISSVLLVWDYIRVEGGVFGGEKELRE